MTCCYFGQETIEIPQPTRGYMMGGLCDKHEGATATVKAGEVIEAYQLVSMDGGKIIADDSDPTKFYGISMKAVDATDGDVEAQFFVGGKYDGEQTVLASKNWDDADVTEGLRDKGLYLLKRY